MVGDLNYDFSAHENKTTRTNNSKNLNDMFKLFQIKH